jgi:hypothetical protein
MRPGNKNWHQAQHNPRKIKIPLFELLAMPVIKTLISWGCIPCCQLKGNFPKNWQQGLQKYFLGGGYLKKLHLFFETRRESRRRNKIDQKISSQEPLLLNLVLKIA